MDYLFSNSVLNTACGVIFYIAVLVVFIGFIVQAKNIKRMKKTILNQQAIVINQWTVIDELNKQVKCDQNVIEKNMTRIIAMGITNEQLLFDQIEREKLLADLQYQVDFLKAVKNHKKRPECKKN